jgi:hypothetical protein
LNLAARCRRAEIPSSSFDAFDLREPVPTPDQIRGRLSLEHAMWLRITHAACWTATPVARYHGRNRLRKNKNRGGLRRWVSIQVAILKVLASHGSGRATLGSLKSDVAILAASGPDWNTRLKRLAQRAPTIDIFGSGYVLRDDEGWEITAAGRDFLRMLEAVTQDNRPPVSAQAASDSVGGAANPRGALIVVGHRFRNRVRRRRSALPARGRRVPVFDFC